MVVKDRTYECGLTALARAGHGDHGILRSGLAENRLEISFDDAHSGTGR
jgi:hypothetical protein